MVVIVMLVEVPLVEGGSVLVEVDAVVDDRPVVRGRGAADAVSSLAEPLEHVLAGLGPVTRAVISQLRELSDSPHEIEVEFSVKLTAEAKIVIARAASEANFRIALKWTRTTDSPPPLGGEH